MRDPELIKFEEILPFYITKKLSEEEMEFCAKYILQNIELNASIVFLQKVKDLVAGIKTKHHLNDGLLRLQVGLAQKKNKSYKMG